MNNLNQKIATALGLSKADLLIKNARIFHLTTGEFETADIAILNGDIVGIGQDLQAKETFDAAGLTAVPGFIDTHFHVESSLVTPWEYEKCVLPHGVTTTICDPHELANVVGEKAFELFFQAAESMHLDLQVRLSSCVPATSLETAGAEITAEQLAKWKRLHPEACLAEYMNVPGILSQDAETIKKLTLFAFIDGHAPLLAGKELNACLSAGIRNDHECSNLMEAQEKIRRGMHVFIREGSVARNLDTLLPLITLENSPLLAFCTDDRNLLDMMEHGHIDNMIARALAAGANPLAVYRTASFSAARACGFSDRGLIAPGQRADIVLLDDFQTCHIHDVFVHGQHVTDSLFLNNTHNFNLKPFKDTVHIREVRAQDFELPFSTEETPVIGVTDGSIITDFLKLPSSADGLAKLAVLERHGRNGHIANAYVKGFGLQRGAIASSVGHDSHNLCVVGADSSDMALAVNALRQMQGGFVVTINGRVISQLPLPIAGLMSERPATEIVQELKALHAATHQTGCSLHDPLMQLAFIPLCVIPHLKLTDCGLVDVDKFQLL